MSKDPSYQKEVIPPFEASEKLKLTEKELVNIDESLSPTERIEKKIEELFKFSSVIKDDEKIKNLQKQFNDLIHLRNMIKSMSSLKETVQFDILPIYQERKKKLIDELISIM